MIITHIVTINRVFDSFFIYGHTTNWVCDRVSFLETNFLKLSWRIDVNKSVNGMELSEIITKRFFR